MSSSNKSTTSSPDKPKATPSGKPLGFVDACIFDSLDAKDPPPFQKKDLIVLLNKCDSFPKHLKVAFLKDFTWKNVLALAENSAKSQLLKICQDCYRSMGATVSSMNRNWGILYVAKQLGAIMLTFHEYKVLTKDLQSTSNCKSKPLEMLKKAKAKEIAVHNAKIGKLAKLWKKTGQRPQDVVKSDPKKILKRTCLQCGHFNTMELQSAKEIEKINKQLENEHQIEMLHWENKPTAVKLKTRKPRKKPTQERQIACCYCHNVHCMLEPSRGVCYRCCGYVEDGKDLPMDQTGKACKCEVCLCKCDLVFVESKRLAIASAINPLKEPDEEKAVVGGASLFLSYVEGKIDSCVNEQYLANPFATKVDHLQNTHATAFLDIIISDPVLGSARDGKKIDQLGDEKRGVKSEPFSDSWFYRNKLSLEPMDPARFLCNRTLKKAPTETPMDTPLEIGSYPLAMKLIHHTPSRNQEPPKVETPAFAWSVRQLAFKKVDFQMNSQDTQDILDFVEPKVTYKDDLEVAVNMKVFVSDHDRELDLFEHKSVTEPNHPTEGGWSAGSKFLIGVMDSLPYMKWDKKKNASVPWFPLDDVDCKFVYVRFCACVTLKVLSPQEVLSAQGELPNKLYLLDCNVIESEVATIRKHGSQDQYFVLGNREQWLFNLMAGLEHKKLESIVKDGEKSTLI
eukprot:jgi/Psemu1/7207/gm1.7207_g